MDQIEEIKDYLKIINSNFEKAIFKSEKLVDFCISEVLDRLKIYLNQSSVPKELNRIIAKIISERIDEIINDKYGKSKDNFISSISDNGQSINFSNEIATTLIDKSDEEIFSGYTKILKNYRRLNIVGNSYNNEKQN